MIRSTHLPRFVVSSCFRFVLLLCCILFTGINAVAADDSKSSEIDYPLVVFNAASVQRLRDNASVMFESAEREDLTDAVDNWTVNTLKDIQGLDRLRPFGVMLYLNTESFMQPTGITYLPVINLDEALQTLAYGSGTIVPVEGNADRHEIQFDGFKIRTLFRNRYLFVTGPDGNDTTLDFNFPDPEKLTTRLSNDYDVAVSCLIKTIPSGMKTLALAAVKSQLIADLQQRDDEPESVYRLRRASGEGWVDLLDKVVNFGEELTIGGRIDQDTSVGIIEVEIAGTPNSKLAKYFQKMTGKKTYFGNLLTTPATFAMSTSWQLEESQRKAFITYFEAAQRDLAKKTDLPESDTLKKIIDPVLGTLTTTADVGHLDAFAQMNGAEQENFVLLGGVKLSTSSKTPDLISELMEYFRDNPNGNDLFEKIEVGADSIDSLPVHRLEINPEGDAGQRMFGQSAQLYLYASPQAIWVAYGGEPALQTLRESVASVALPQPPQQSRNRVPFQFVTHAKNWLAVKDTNNPNAAGFNERAEASFESDNDAMTIEIRPTDRGLKLRTEFQSGFLSLMGRGFANGMENGFFPRREGRNRNQNQNQPIPDAAPPKTTN